MDSSEIQRRLKNVQVAVQEFNQYVMHIDGSYDQKQNEIKSLEMRLENLKEQTRSAQDKANSILQQASDDASRERNEAKRLLDEAKSAKIAADMETKKSISMQAEAQNLMNLAQQKQREADNFYRILEERKRKIEETLKI